MSVSKYLAIDLGAESGRAIVGVLENGKISLDEVHRFPNKHLNIGGHLFWNYQELFFEIKRGISLAVQKGHADIESIGIDTWGVDYGLIGEDNKILGNPYCYRDPRTDGIMEKVFEKIPMGELYSRTGIQFMQINTLYQLYSQKLSDPELLASADKLLFIPDLFNFLLTGEKKTEYTIASTSQLMNARTKKFDEKIFATLGLPLGIMPEIIMPGTIIGKLLPEIANETGICTIDVVAVGCHDTASAVAAVPGVGDDWAYLSSGTWSLLGIENEEPLLDQKHNDDFTNEGGVANKIRFLRNTMGLWFLQELKKSWERKDENLNYEEITRLAAAAEGNLCMIDPDNKIFLNPSDMTEAIKEFCIITKQTVPETKGEFARAVMDSLAHRYKMILEKIEEISGKKIGRLHIVGGGSQNRLLNQLTSNATGRLILAGPTEATALGNIMVQAVAKGKVKFVSDARKVIAKSFPVTAFFPNDYDKLNRENNFINSGGNGK